LYYHKKTLPHITALNAESRAGKASCADVTTEVPPFAVPIPM
jgi:hypothetical protein